MSTDDVTYGGAGRVAALAEASEEFAAATASTSAEGESFALADGGNPRHGRSRYPLPATRHPPWTAAIYIGGDR
jgi:hypothetical protein